ncbi:IS66 family insertion sequence element accessory protein TnpB [Mangrovicoccus ximenensis]|uniref:IS66 family insertion sequence element accessory protein TnpB n=1 Tax=Mangrovicoccus ximenensis TaxID=1911570 RepID=UPI000D343CB7
MIPSGRVRFRVATKPVELRKGHDGLSALVQPVPEEDPFAGAVFVFRSKRADRPKLLFRDDGPCRAAAHRARTDGAAMGNSGRQRRMVRSWLASAWRSPASPGLP